MMSYHTSHYHLPELAQFARNEKPEKQTKSSLSQNHIAVVKGKVNKYQMCGVA